MPPLTSMLATVTRLSVCASVQRSPHSIFPARATLHHLRALRIELLTGHLAICPSDLRNLQCLVQLQKLTYNAARAIGLHDADVVEMLHALPRLQLLSLHMGLWTPSSEVLRAVGELLPLLRCLRLSRPPSLEPFFMAQSALPLFSRLEYQETAGAKLNEAWNYHV